MQEHEHGVEYFRMFIDLWGGTINMGWNIAYGAFWVMSGFAIARVSKTLCKYIEFKTNSES